jgi:hypothetical protein
VMLRCRLSPPTKERGVGHFLFAVLHLIAILFGLWALVITIPLHLIYAAVSGKKPGSAGEAVSPETHARCPDCRELVRADAVRCKHCGATLTPTDISAAVAEMARQKAVDSSSKRSAMTAAIALGSQGTL